MLVHSALWLRISRALSPQSVSAERTQLYGQRVQEISRRTVMRTAAWSVPVIAAAVATPMAAASETLMNVNVGYVGAALPYLQVFGTTSSYVHPRLEHFVVNGTPQVHVIDMFNLSASDLSVQLTLNEFLTTVTGYTLTIGLPGFTPVTVPIVPR